MHRKLTALVALTLGVVASRDARAQSVPGGEQTWYQRHVEAPARTLEVTVGTGYTQGFGNLESGVGMPSVATPGVGVDVGVAYRIDPRWSVGVTGQYQELEAERASGARGFTAGVAATYHLKPDVRLDPWISLGTGYRFLWETHAEPSSNLVTHGFELAKLTVGVDVRVDKNVAIAPVVGADMNVFLWHEGASSATISDPRVSTFVFAGLQGRFDVPTARRERASEPQTEITQAKVIQRTEPRPVTATLTISQDVLDTCKVDLDSIDKAPKFDFDKSDLTAADRALLSQIADCFTTGPMKGRGLELVGRADPRGSVEYNDVLGMRRADNVASFLEERGVDSHRIDLKSRGKREARGTDEATWAIDRRVDLSAK